MYHIILCDLFLKNNEKLVDTKKHKTFNKKNSKLSLFSCFGVKSNIFILTSLTNYIFFYLLCWPKDVN